MKISHLAILLCAVIVGCHREPTTLLEEAEQAQQNLESARMEAAEVIAESEEDAVEIVADARDEAEEAIQDGKREAADIISDAKEELTEKLNELGTSPSLESKPEAE